MRRLVLLFTLLFAAGCNCGGDGVKQNVGDVEFGPDLHFGTVSVGDRAVQKAKVTNTGTDGVVIERFEVAAPFSTSAITPIELEPGESFEVEVTFTPTEPNVGEQDNYVAELWMENSTEALPRLKINLDGHAVKADFVFTPANLDFGDVDVGGVKGLQLSLENRGSERVEITRVSLDSAVFATHDLNVFKTTFNPGTVVTAYFNYTPTAGRTDEATLVLATTSPSAPELRLPLVGRGLASAVTLCYGFPGEPPTCLPRKDVEGNQAYVGDLQFGALDEGTSRKAIFTLANAGNVQVELFPMLGGNVMTKDFNFSKNPCGDKNPVADYGFAPAAFSPKLAENATEAMEVTYTPHHSCTLDLSDTARLSFRAGSAAGAPTFLVTMRGASRLGLVREGNLYYEMNMSDVRPFSVSNEGFGPLHLAKVELVEGNATKNQETDCAAGCMDRQPCEGSSHPECQPFSWAKAPADGIDIAPATVGADGTVTFTKVDVGRIAFTPPKRCAAGQTTGCIPRCTSEITSGCLSDIFKTCVKIQSNDPYRPFACGELKAKAF